YRQYHAFFQPHKNAITTNKIKRWKNFGKEAPPNIFVLGIDSMSSANFGRTMPKTKQVLKDLGAREMLGYTKVGYNTFPNMVPGMTEDRVCEATGGLLPTAIYVHCIRAGNCSKLQS
ncbi:unnamed protein product, partial [Allacma fusca]